MQLIPRIPERAALARGLSDSSATRSRPWRPLLRSYAPCGSVRDYFRPLSITCPSRGPCSPLFPFPSLPHSRAAYETRHRCAGDHASPVYNTSRSAEACKTACTASHPQKSCAPKTHSLAIREGLGYHHCARVSWTPWHSYRMGVCRSQ